LRETQENAASAPDGTAHNLSVRIFEGEACSREDVGVAAFAEAFACDALAQEVGDRVLLPDDSAADVAGEDVEVREAPVRSLHIGGALRRDLAEVHAVGPCAPKVLRFERVLALAR
jgi:hypothetical protein